MEKLRKGSAGEAVDPSQVRLLFGVPQKVTVELGSARMATEDLLRVGEGSVIQLDAMHRQPLLIRVNGALVAEGELVELPMDSSGIKVLEILDEDMRRIRNTQDAPGT